jgi:hypothetical protein
MKAPTLAMNDTDSIDIECDSTGQWYLRDCSLEFDALLSQLACIRQLKAPRNTIDVWKFGRLPSWECALTLEELYISVKDLYNPLHIANTLLISGANPVKVFKKMRDVYDSSEGIVPLAPEVEKPYRESTQLDMTDNDDISIDSHSQLQEYMEKVLHHEGDLDLENENNKGSRLDQNSFSAPWIYHAPPTLDLLQNTVPQFLHRFNNLRYIWVGDGLYEFPSRKSAESSGINVQSQGETSIYQEVIPMHESTENEMTFANYSSQSPCFLVQDHEMREDTQMGYN